MAKAAFNKKSFHQQTGLLFKKETSEMLHLEHTFVRCVWCWDLDISESRSEIRWEFWNVVLEKDAEDQLDQPCEKWRSKPITWVKEERNIIHIRKWRKANWIGHTLSRNCLLKNHIEEKMAGTKIRGRRRKQSLDGLRKRYWKLK
jgi:hypothetical protein